MAKKKTTIAICVDDDLVNEIREEAKALRLSLSAYMSMIIAKRVKEWKILLMKIMI